MMNEKLPKHSEQMMPPSSGTNMQAGGASLSGLDPSFENVGIDPLQFDYSSAFMQSIDSPSAIDYGNQVSVIIFATKFLMITIFVHFNFLYIN